MSAVSAVQTAIYSTLSADATLLALATGGIRNWTSPDQAYPYVLIANAHEKTWHTMGGASSGLGWNLIVRTHIYSRYRGDDEALDILNRIVALLNFASLSVSGYTTAICEYESGRMLIEDIDKVQTRHFPAEFRVRVHQ